MRDLPQEKRFSGRGVYGGERRRGVAFLEKCEGLWERKRRKVPLPHCRLGPAGQRGGFLASQPRFIAPLFPAPQATVLLGGSCRLQYPCPCVSPATWNPDVPKEPWDLGVRCRPEEGACLEASACKEQLGLLDLRIEDDVEGIFAESASVPVSALFPGEKHGWDGIGGRDLD